MKTVGFTDGKATGTLQTLSLLEELEENQILFWASIHLDPTPEGKYEAVAWTPTRSQLMKCEPDVDSIEEARVAITEYMKNSKVITKKDIVEHA